MKRCDFLVVGQGLAGTVLAYTLLKKGCSVRVVDDGSLSSCSRVAAGNMNPVVFKRLAPTWKADALIPFAKKFYRETEEFLEQQFFLDKEIVKLFSGENDKGAWLKRAHELPEYLSEKLIKGYQPDILNNDCGGALVRQAGNLYVAKFLDDFRDHFRAEGILAEEKFEYDKLADDAGSVQYGDITARRIIFCEGWKALGNPFLKDLPFRPAKGELLTVRIPGLDTDKIVHKGLYLLPVGPELFIAGATYRWHKLDDTPTDEARKELVEKLKKMLHVPFEIVGHEAGVRPAISDRRPVIGMLPGQKNMGVFNGMGSKGVMLAPFFAEQFAEHLLSGKALSDEVDLRRFL
ncbi:MAG: FAD-dependent oxidoreductase [Bacteroidota bacterium]